MSSYETILVQTYETLRPFASGQTLTEDTDLLVDLNLDSMRMMELVFEAEDRFDVSIPLNTLASVRTVRDFAHRLQELTADR
ncbi:MAG TPA: acyl carrier protein [Methylomirabilota bacterium]|jgi:acyl carrier protein|nr:acyl carrier protein [Methylomirabilota bacterium]